MIHNITALASNQDAKRPLQSPEYQRLYNYLTPVTRIHICISTCRPIKDKNQQWQKKAPPIPFIQEQSMCCTLLHVFKIIHNFNLPLFPSFPLALSQPHPTPSWNSISKVILIYHNTSLSSTFHILFSLNLYTRSFNLRDGFYSAYSQTLSYH